MKTRPLQIMGFLFLIGVDTFSQVCFKMAATQATPFAITPEWLMRVLTDPWVYGAILGYCIAFVTWMTLLRNAPIGPAFAVSHMEVIGVMLISVPLFGEQLSPQQLFGAGVILAGVICLAFSEAKTEHA